MDKKKILQITVGVIVMIIGLAGMFWYAYASRNPVVTPKGSLFVSVADANNNTEGMDDVKIKIEKVEIHNEANGWVAVSSNVESYKLLELKESGMAKYYVDEKLDAGVYDGIRFTLGDVTVANATGTDIKASLPSNQITANMVVKIEKESHTHVMLSFLTDKSLHLVNGGKYVFSPVIKAISRSDTKVMVGSEGDVEALGGTIDSSLDIGVDLDGVSKEGFVLDTQTGLVVDDTIGNTRFILGGKVYTSVEVMQEDL